MGGVGKKFRKMCGEVGMGNIRSRMTHVVRRRPTRQGKTKWVNRAPTPSEVKKCHPLLMDEIMMCHPKVIVCVGELVARQFIDHVGVMIEKKRQGIKKWRGSAFYDVQVVPVENERGHTCHVVLTLHPKDCIGRRAAEIELIRGDLETAIHAVKPIKIFPPSLSQYVDCPTTEDLLRYTMNAGLRNTPLAIDIETSYDEKRRLERIGISRKNTNAVTWLHRKKDQDLHVLERTIFKAANPAIFHNGAFDTDVLSRDGLWNWDTPLYDTLLAHHAINATLPHDLGSVATQYLPVQFWKHTATTDPIGYNCKDVDYTFQLYAILKDKVEKLGMTTLVEQHYNDLIPIVVHMKQKGMRRNLDECQRLYTSLHEEIHLLEKEIPTGIDWRSSKQLGVFFKEAGIPLPLTDKGNPSVAEEVLLKAQVKTPHPAIDLILALRDKSKFADTYLKPELGEWIHPSYKMTGAYTGRFSCENPNLQNVPKKGPMRKMYIPHAQGRMITSADFKQMEIYTAAWTAGQMDLIDLLPKVDIYNWSVSEMTGVPMDAVSDTRRFQQKSVILGQNYGRQPPAIAKALHRPVSEVEGFAASWFTQFPKIKSHREHRVKEMRKKGFIANPFGRRMLQYGWIDAPKIYAFDGQSTGADVMKLSLRELWRNLPSSEVYIVGTVHDEVLVDHPIEMKSVVEEWVKDCMEREWLPGLVIPVDVGSSEISWGEIA